MASSPAREPVDVGSVIADTYTIEALLGRGGMGAVFLASHKRLAGKRVAIKILHTEIEGTEVVARFKREAEIAAKLNHPNIVGVIDYNVSPAGMPYLVLDYLEGETLAARIARGPLSVDQVLSIVRQVGSALAAAHRAGIVHRDLKPQNIFLVPTEVDGRHLEIAKVLDFGISKIRGSQTVKTQDSVLLGTPQYMAPEQAIGQHANIDERTDVFALGAIVYEMLSGQAAFSGESLPAVVFKVVYEQPPPLAQEVPSVPPAIAAAVTRAMAKPPEERFATISGFVEAMTGQPLATRDLDSPALPIEGSPSGSRRAAAREAFAQTMDSGELRDDRVNSLLATAAPGAAGRQSASTAPGATNAPSTVGASKADAARATGAASPASWPGASATPAVDLRSNRTEPPSPRRRSTGLIVAIAIAGAAAAAGVMYVVMRPSAPTQRVAAVDPGSVKPADTRPADTKPADTKPADTKPADTKPADTKPADAKPADTKPADTKPADAKPADTRPADTKPADTRPADTRPTDAKPSGSKPTDPKPGRIRPSPGNARDPRRPPAPVDDAEGDGDVRDKLQQANAALARREYDLAERLANAVINSPGSPRQRAAGRLVHGTVQCVARNDQEVAQIDLRGLEKFRVLRAKLLSVCRNHGIVPGP
jgi:serine/threonine-protein kinase